MDSQISKEAWIDWKDSEITKHFLTAINTKREVLKEALVEGHTGEDFNTYIGQCQGIKDCLDYALTYNEQEPQEEETSRGSESN